MSESTAEKAVQAIVRRADERFEADRRRNAVGVDRLFRTLLIGQWAFAILVAVVISPWGWEGRMKTVHAHVWTAVVLGGVINSLPLYLIARRPGSELTRHVVAAAQMLWSALLIHLWGGRIETHFHVFGSLGILSGYRDWRILVTATVVIAGDHLLRGMLWPESVYGIVNPEWWRFLEHAFWVVYAVAFLIPLCRRGIADLRAIADRSAEIEALAEGEWRKSSVLDRIDEGSQPEGAPADAPVASGAGVAARAS